MTELTEQQKYVCFNKGTEAPFTGMYWNYHESGTYHCVICGVPLFRSEAKFDSGTGWPSFSAPIDRSRVSEREDREYGMQRTEIVCANCGSHLGHVFDDGPVPTGMRYCVNSVSLQHKKD